ncbi:head-tail connector protein [Rhizobium sp. BK661]|uniref:head-tail connector protein n=1 Tax=Rhizobium sp. BK661 TaxID=2586991 RepID=UPI00216701C6|nr:head-tail connector protein [Rhizobium sp. BK661]MCS3740231.1 putative phage protein (predicted DNA packaging) [Rhizobium sp. BK661]
MSTVALSLAKQHLNIDNSGDDELIQLYIDAAEGWLGNYIGKPFSAFETVPADLKLAVLKLVGFYYEQREAIALGISMQIAPYGVISVADSYREKWFGDGE